MTRSQCKASRINLQEVFGADKVSLKELLREVLQEVLEQEMTDALGAEKGERSPGRLGYRSGYYSRQPHRRDVVGGGKRGRGHPGPGSLTSAGAT